MVTFVLSFTEDDLNAEKKIDFTAAAMPHLKREMVTACITGHTFLPAVLGKMEGC